MNNKVVGVKRSYFLIVRGIVIGSWRDRGEAEAWMGKKIEEGFKAEEMEIMEYGVSERVKG